MTACLDWRERIMRRESLIPVVPRFPGEAAAGLAVMRELRIVDAPGSPTIGESCGAWVLDFAAAIFGSYDPDSGRRSIRESFLMVPKKASKSTIAAAIMMTLLLRNWRMSAELIILAPTVEVANNAFAPARDMVKVDEELGDLLHVQDHIRTITHRTTGATLKVVAADANTVAGKKAAYVLVDEIHQFGTMAGSEAMLREATGGLAARPEGCVIYLTTQSDEPPAGIFAQKLAYARAVRDGRIDDPEFLPVIYELPETIQDEIRETRRFDPALFDVVNPNIGLSVDRGFLERELRKAVSEGIESLAGFLAKFANVEVGLALQSNRWAGAEFWERQGTAGLTMDEMCARCEVVDVGIDGGGLDDLLGLVVLGRERETGNWLCWARAYAHPSVLTRRKSEASRFRDFEADGDLVLVDKVGDDVADVVRIVAALHADGLLDRIGVDAHGIGGILDALIAAGIDSDAIVGISQGWKLNGAIGTTERKLAEGVLWHQGSRLMAWCVGNAKVEPKGNAVAITKQAAGRAKIDPLMALFNAVTLLSLNPQARSGFFVETW